MSQDGLETFSQDQSFVEHGWLPNLNHHPKVTLYSDKELRIEKGRSFWAYHPLPGPPVVRIWAGTGVQGTSDFLRCSRSPTSGYL